MGFEDFPKEYLENESEQALSDARVARPESAREEGDRMRPPIIDAIAKKTIEYMGVNAIPSALKNRIEGLLHDAKIIAHERTVQESGKDPIDAFIDAESVRVGFEELRNEFLEFLLEEKKEAQEGADNAKGTEGITSLQRDALIEFIQSAEAELSMLPLPHMIITPEEGIKRLHQCIQEQKESPYGRIAEFLGEKMRGGVERAVRNILESLAGRIPFEKREKIIVAASKLSGKFAFGLTVFGTGLLALGVGQQESSAAVNVEMNQESNVLEMKDTETGKTVSAVPYEALGNYTPSEQKNSMYEQFVSYDNSFNGVNYTIENPELFERIIIEDANAIAKELFDTSPKDLSVPDFITLVNEMVQRKIEYDNEAIKKSNGVNLEDEKISSMPLDVMYLKYGLGVCRHYAALVEEIFEMLRDNGTAPQMRGVSVDGVRGNEDPKSAHAWLMYVLNPKSDPNKVVIGFTDPTFADTGKPELEARDGSHSSITDGVIGRSPFSKGDLEGIYKQLIDLNLGPMENKVAGKFLAMPTFDEGVEKYFNEMRSLLNDEGAKGSEAKKFTFAGSETETLLMAARKYAAMGGIYDDRNMNFIFTNSSRFIIDAHEKAGTLENAAKIAQYTANLLGISDNDADRKVEERFSARAEELRQKIAKTH